MDKYNKFIVAMLSAGVVVLTPFIPSVAEVADPEWVQSAAAIIGAIAVYVVPNAPMDEEVI